MGSHEMIGDAFSFFSGYGGITGSFYRKRIIPESSGGAWHLAGNVA